MSRVNVDRDERPGGGVQVSAMPSAQYAAQTEAIARSFSLGEDAYETLLVSVGPDGVTATVRAFAADVQESQVFEMSKGLTEDLLAFLDRHREPVREALKIGMAKTMVANLTAVAATPTEPTEEGD